MKCKPSEIKATLMANMRRALPSKKMPRVLKQQQLLRLVRLLFVKILSQFSLFQLIV